MHIYRYYDPTIKQNNKPKYLITKAHYHTYKEKTTKYNMEVAVVKEIFIKDMNFNHTCTLNQ
jgi:hypothetical protein